MSADPTHVNWGSSLLKKNPSAFHQSVKWCEVQSAAKVRKEMESLGFMSMVIHGVSNCRPAVMKTQMMAKIHNRIAASTFQRRGRVQMSIIVSPFLIMFHAFWDIQGCHCTATQAIRRRETSIISATHCDPSFQCKEMCKMED